MAIFPPANSGASGSNYNPPEADKSSKYFNVWMPVPLYLSGGGIIFAFLDLGKNISFSDSLLCFSAFPGGYGEGISRINSLKSKHGQFESL